MVSERKPGNTPERSKDKVQSRRKVLKKIALGGSAAAGAFSMPAQWVKPIVDRVIVPSHAQTSPEPTTTPCRQAHQVEGCRAECGIENNSDYHHWYVDDIGGKCEIVSLSSEQQVPVADVVSTRCFTFPGPNDPNDTEWSHAQADIALNYDYSSATHHHYLCDIDFAEEVPVNFSIKSTSGSTYQVTGSVIWDGWIVELSTLNVDPA